MAVAHTPDLPDDDRQATNEKGQPMSFAALVGDGDEAASFEQGGSSQHNAGAAHNLSPCPVGFDFGIAPFEPLQEDGIATGGAKQATI